MSTTYKTSEISDFLAKVDKLGGPSSKEAQPLLADFRLAYSTYIDVEISPYSDEYVNQQISLYKEITGFESYTSHNELMIFDVEAHAKACNPYGLRDPSTFVFHHLRIGETIQRANLPVAPRVLDMGCGWGLSSEFLAVLGADVVAVDINPIFIELVKKRSARLGLPIKAVQSSFEDFKVEGYFDFIFFYECLHHSVRPWDLIEKCASHLKSDGKIGLAAEPIQDIWWPNWGLRLDGLSVYCIAKFGWFESGWSRQFLSDMCVRAGLNFSLWDHSDGRIGTVGIGAVSSITIDPASLKNGWIGSGWLIDTEHVVSVGHSTLYLDKAPLNRQASLHIDNFRGKDVTLKIFQINGIEFDTVILHPGRSVVTIDPQKTGRNVTLEAETWIPEKELNNGDRRLISFHLSKILFNKT